MDVLEHRIYLGKHLFWRRGWIPATLWVFCAVMAVIATAPCTLPRRTLSGLPQSARR